MALAASKRTEENLNIPITRVYSHASTAVKNDFDGIGAIEKSRGDSINRIEHHHPAVKAKRDSQTGKQLMLVTMIGVIAAAMLLMMIRYSFITREYAVINELKCDIKEKNENLASLNVQLNGSVDIDTAREAALAAGLNYPTVEQIIKVGITDPSDIARADAERTLDETPEQTPEEAPGEALPDQDGGTDGGTQTPDDGGGAD